MGKGIGFNRNIRMGWLEAAAAYRQQRRDPADMRRLLNAVVAIDIPSAHNRRKAIDILLNIWVHSREVSPALHHDALGYLDTARSADERLWLHYGLVLLAYPFFRSVASEVGKLGRQGEFVTSAAVKRWLLAHRGNLGSLGKAIERVLFSMRDWRLLEGTGQRHVYAVRQAVYATTQPELELWLLACALKVHPAEELPLLDLLRLPELFAFRLTVGADALRRSARFAIARQGSGWDAVRLRGQAGATGAADQARRRPLSARS